MKGTEGKFIGINQRVPFKVLDHGLIRMLQTGKLSREEILRDLLEYTGGHNRASKASKYAVTILSRPQALLKVLKEQVSAEAYMQMPTAERKALVTALLACAFPIAYDLLVIFGAGFKVQSQLNRAYVNQKMSSMYGSNRTLDIALDALIPMLIDLDAIGREKAGIYSLGFPTPLNTPIVSDAYIYADIKCSGSKSILVQDIISRPWYVFHPVQYDKLKHKYLVQFVEGRIGGGYVTLGVEG